MSAQSVSDSYFEPKNSSNFKQCSLGSSNSLQTSSAQQWLSECSDSSDKTNSVFIKLSIQYIMYVFAVVGATSPPVDRG